MSEEQLKAFMAKVKDDTSIQEKLKAATDPDAVVVISKAAGFMISVDDLNKAAGYQKLSEEDLEGVAGGGGDALQELVELATQWLAGHKMA